MDEIFISRQLMAIRPYLISQSFFYLILLTTAELFQQRRVGIAIPGISREDVLERTILLPPLAEQHRIVAKVDQLMSLCDELEARQQKKAQTRTRLNNASLDRLLEARDPGEFATHWQRIHHNFPLLYDNLKNVTKLRAAILQLAVMGKLVPQDPHDEPASVLLETIENGKARQRKNARAKKVEWQIDASRAAKLFRLPTGWNWAQLGWTGIGTTGRTPSTREPQYYGGDIPFLGPGQITSSGEITEPDKFLTSIGSENSVMDDRGDILMVCIGGSIGKSAMVNSRIAFNQQINCIRPMGISAGYLYLSMIAPYFQSAVLREASGSATPIINRSKWEGLPVALPPLAEQYRIVAKVDQIMALCDELEAQIKQADSTAERYAEAAVKHVAAA